MTLVPVIIAGGQGTRFWPASRKSLPKQFLKFGNSDQTLISASADRLKNLASPEDIFVVTNQDYLEQTQTDLPDAQIITEPCPRNTAPAVGLAAAIIAKTTPDAVMLVCWADAAIGNQAEYERVINLACQDLHGSENLGAIAVEPEFAHTGYGYIEAGEKIANNIYQVKRFCEKPDSKTAESFIQSGNFYWNPGLFIWPVKAILNAYQEFLPEMYAHLQIIADSWGNAEHEKVKQEIFPQLESVAIDYAIMEKVSNLRLYPARDLQWSDIGSWDVWADFYEKDAAGNTVQADTVLIDSKNNLINSNQDKLIALIGVENLVVIDRGDSLLICPKDQAQSVKKVVEELKSQKRSDLL